MSACKYCYAINVQLINGACYQCQKTIEEARPIDDKEMELWET
jgi:hypothetical protein